MNITLVINGQDFAPSLSTYEVTKEVRQDAVVTTMNHTEHYYGETQRTIITFSLIPYSGALTANFNALMASRPLTVKFTDPCRPGEHQQEFMLASDFSSRFLLHNVNGAKMYRGEKIVLRALEVD